MYNELKHGLGEPDKERSKEELDALFAWLKENEALFFEWSGQAPTFLVINTDVLRSMSKIDGFFQRPELNSEVTVYAPMVRYIKLNKCAVTIREDYDENFMHLE